MDILMFDSFDDMSAALEQHHRHAMENLAPAQRNIKPGDYWVRFVDLDTQPPVIEFGHVLTPTEIAVSMLDDGVSFEETSEFIAEKKRALIEDGLMWGTAASRLEPYIQLGQTHVAYVWPIEERLYNWAAAISWDITRETVPGFPEHLDTAAARVLLEIAFRQMRAHYLPDRFAEHEPKDPA